MAILEKEIKSVSEYLEVITALKSNHEKLWFRGHASNEYTLMPTIYRAPYTWKNEAPLLHQFKARASHFLSHVPNKDSEWLFIMQHHATPTRLLDWSENALVALSFAVQYRSDKHIGKDADIWCLDPIKLNSNIRFPSYEDESIPNICENSELEKMYDSPRQNIPVAIIGPQNTERIIAQKGVFTLFPNKDSFKFEELDGADEYLIRIKIPYSHIDSIKDDLYYIGVTESSLFPELDSISKELKRTYEGGK